MRHQARDIFYTNVFLKILHAVPRSQIPDLYSQPTVQIKQSKNIQTPSGNEHVSCTHKLALYRYSNNILINDAH